MLPKKYITFIQDPQNNYSGFILTTDAFFTFFRHNDLQTKINHLLGTLPEHESVSLEKMSKSIQKLIKDSLYPEDMVGEIFQAYALISSTVTDATIHLKTDTVSEIIKGEATLLLIIKDIWASLFSVQSLKEQTLHHLLEKGTAIHIDKVITDKKHPEEAPSQTIHKEHEEKNDFFSLTATRVYADIATPYVVEELAKRQIDGVGVLHAEFLIQQLLTHPKHILHSGKRKEYTEQLAEKISKFAHAFSPRPVIYKPSNFTTQEYRTLEEGHAFEAFEENPQLGFRGVYRYLQDPDMFGIELDAIKLVRNNMGLKNVWLLLPFVRSVENLSEIKKRIAESGLYRSPSFKLWLSIDLPANVILLDKFIETGMDGLSIQLDTLTTLMLGVDRKNIDVAREFTEEHEAVLWAVEHVLKTAHKHHITSSLSTQTALSEKIIKHLIRWGITSISTEPTYTMSVRQSIAEIEKSLLQ